MPEEAPVPVRPGATLKKPAKDMDPAVGEFVDGLRVVFAGCGVSLRVFAARHHYNAGTVSRYLSGQRTPNRGFLDSVLKAAADSGSPVTEEVRQQLYALHLRVLEAANPARHQIQVLQDQLLAQTHAADLAAREERMLGEELASCLAERQQLLEEKRQQLEEKRQLEADLDTAQIRHNAEVAVHQARLQDLQTRIAELEDLLKQAHDRRIEAEQHCAQLEHRLDSAEAAAESERQEHLRHQETVEHNRRAEEQRLRDLLAEQTSELEQLRRQQRPPQPAARHPATAASQGLTAPVAEVDDPPPMIRPGQAKPEASTPEGASPSTSADRLPDPQAPQSVGTGVPVELELAEVVFGTERKVSFKIPERCPVCRGSGRTLPEEVTCGTCYGSRIAEGMGEYGGSVTGPCPRCAATGTVMSKPKKCPSCTGTGQIHHRADRTVKIPPGVRNGTRIPLYSEAINPGPGPRFVEIIELPHPTFERRGDDLHCTTAVLTATATTGTTVPLATLDGPVDIDIPPQTQSGDVITLPGYGVQHQGQPGRGDLVVHIEVKKPGRGRRLLNQVHAELRDAFWSPTPPPEEQTPYSGPWGSPFDGWAVGQ